VALDLGKNGRMVEDVSASMGELSESSDSRDKQEFEVKRYG
jgi:hypothetical protein